MELTEATVNELSGTMDLQSTLIRAESLYRRFQRTVETIDKKQNFPSAPQARQRKSIASPPTSPGPSDARPEAASSGTDKGKQTVADEETRVISPELRSLLSKKIEKLDKGDVSSPGSGSK
jgi:DNA-nicking Smr family endonuclease